MARGLVETVQEFAKRFEVKCAAIEARVQRIIDAKCSHVVKDFDGLEDFEKDYFVRKATEVDVHSKLAHALKEKFAPSRH